MKNGLSFSTLLATARKRGIDIAPFELEFSLLRGKVTGYAVMEEAERSSFVQPQPSSVAFYGVYPTREEAEKAYERFFSDDENLIVTFVNQGLLDTSDDVMLHEGSITQCRRVIEERASEISSIKSVEWATVSDEMYALGHRGAPSIESAGSSVSGHCRIVLNDMTSRYTGGEYIFGRLAIFQTQLIEAQSYHQRFLEKQARSTAIQKKRKAASEKGESPASVTVASGKGIKKIEDQYGQPLTKGSPIIFQLKKSKTPCIGVFHSNTMDEITLCNKDGNIEIIQIDRIAMTMMASLCETIFDSGGMGKAHS